MKSENQTMKAAVSTGYGSPEVLKIQTVRKPIITENELLIKVHFSSVTTADTKMRKGNPFFSRFFTGLKKPKHEIPGTGFSGIVELAGKQCSTFKKGDKVFGLTALTFGANAEYLKISEKDVVCHLSDSISFREACAISDGMLTSYNFLLRLANLKVGQKVLINAASGALGTAAIQLAKNSNAHVTGISSSKNLDFIQYLGCDEVVDYKKQDVKQINEKYDVVFDTLGNLSYSDCKHLLAPQGLFLTTSISFSVLYAMMKQKISTRKNVIFAATGLNKPEVQKEMLDKIISLFEKQKLRLIIDRVYPLEKIVDAHHYVEKGHKKGNVILATLNKD